MNPIRPLSANRQPLRFGDTCKDVNKDDPFLCHCLKVTEQQVEDAVCLKGMDTLEEVRQETEAGTGCAACIHKLKEILKKLGQKTDKA